MKLKLNRFAMLLAIALLLVGVVGAVVIRIAVANGADDGEAPITGDALAQASAAALDYLGGGRVTETEVGDEEGYYEVEVTQDDGRQVDVHLDQNFNVLGQEADAETPGDQDGANNP